MGKTDFESKKHRWIKTILAVTLAAFAAVGVAFYMDPRTPMLIKKTASLDISSVEYVNYQEDGERQVSATSDPQIYLHGVDAPVSGITVSLKEPMERDCPVQLYYAFKDSGFKEKNSKNFWIPEGATEFTVPKDGVATAIRLDIGRSEGIAVNIAQIKVEPAEGKLEILGGILSSGVFWVRIELLLVFFLLAASCVVFGWKKMAGFFYRYRWQAGIVAILFLTVNKIHGDSIAGYDIFVQPGTGSEFVDPVFGEERLIRTDEWVSATGKGLSSRFLAEPFGKYNDLIRGTQTVNPLYTGLGNLGGVGGNVFQIFYRLLGIEYGYYLEWNAAAVLTLLFTFEFFLILTKKKKLLSALGTALVVFSSFHLWWKIPSFLLYIHAIVVLFYYFFTTKDRRVKLLCAVLEPIAVANFVCMFYPAWQVPAAYMLLAFVVWMVHDNWDAVKSQKKEDWFLFGAALCICALLVVTYSSSISDKLEGMLTSVYPGARISTGGQGSLKLFYYFQGFAYPFADFGNASEAGTFCSLFPLPFLLGILYVVREKRRNWLICGLLGVGLVYLVYVYVGFPVWLSKLLLFSYSPTERAMDFVALTGVYLLILFASEKEGMSWTVQWPLGLAVSFAAVFLSLTVCRKLFPGYMIYVYMAVVLAVLSLMGMALVSRLDVRVSRGILLAVILFITAVGLQVRPLQRGLDAIDSKPLAKEIKRINEEDPGQKWIAASNSNILAAYVLACGASTINSVNDYPNLELWNRLDEEKQYNEVYNRYAHVVVDFCEGDTSFELIQPDLFKLHLSYGDLELTGVKYIVSDYSIADDGGAPFEEIYGEAGAYVYRIGG